MTVCLPGTAKLSAGIGRTLSLKKVQIGSVGFTRREGIQNNGLSITPRRKSKKSMLVVSERDFSGAERR